MKKYHFNSNFSQFFHIFFNISLNSVEFAQADVDRTEIVTL